MSDVQVETTDNDNEGTDKKPRKSSKFLLNSGMKEKLKDLPEILEFIEKLQKHIERQKKRLRRLHQKLKKKSDKLQNVACQTGDETKQQSLSEEIKEAAEKATRENGFVFEETSGMYYDYNTGYYYNAEYGLYYDGYGTYMTYNSETKTYEFHSKVSTLNSPETNSVQPLTEEKTKRNNLEQKQAAKRKRRQKSDGEGEGDLEEGECSDESCDENAHDLKTDANETSSDPFDVSNSWPPCMRIIIEKSSLSNVKPGTLHIITYEGGTLGREGEHSILIPDINISKHHLNFKFDTNLNKYCVTDLGSRNGTILNGKRMSASKQESEAMEVEHGSTIQIGSTVLSCHIHPGNQTCENCEPGLLQVEQIEESKNAAISTSKTKQHKKELKKLKKKFGMEQFSSGTTQIAAGYIDRAQARRDTIGSQNPHEKTQVASVNESIPAENKGFKLLSKMGWTEGKSLGKEGLGLVEPINVVGNKGTAGLGRDTFPNAHENKSELPKTPRKQNIWEKTQRRYQNIQSTTTTTTPDETADNLDL